MRIRDWSSDVCSSDLQVPVVALGAVGVDETVVAGEVLRILRRRMASEIGRGGRQHPAVGRQAPADEAGVLQLADADGDVEALLDHVHDAVVEVGLQRHLRMRSEEPTSEPQSLMRNSY